MSNVTTTLTAEDTRGVFEQLAAANKAFLAVYTGEIPDRQPVHTVYGGAQLFRSDRTVRMGKSALATLKEFSDGPMDFLDAIEPLHEYSEEFAQTLYDRVIKKLETEPVEDFRIDFEDGYGNRPDDEEDGHAVAAAQAVAQGAKDGTLPPFIGIRLKPFNEELKARSIRTLDIFLTALNEATGGHIPKPFYITLPKITVPEQAAALADVLDKLEAKLGLKPGTLEVELMIETPQSIFSAEGTVPLQRMVSSLRGRCRGAHFGTYDYTASCQITAEYQDMLHHACDFARSVMQVALAGTGVWISDGATNVLPVPPHRGDLTEEQEQENQLVVRNAWELHYHHVQSSLIKAYYQGWDLHPAHLPTRYAAIYAFFLGGLGPAGERLKNFVEKAAQATLVGDVFDDAATGQGLLNFFLKAINSGAVTEDEVTEATTLTKDELETRSFLKILDGRTKVGTA
jgi:citrate lyase beta subunit